MEFQPHDISSLIASDGIKVNTILAQEAINRLTGKHRSTDVQMTMLIKIASEAMRRRLPKRDNSFLQRDLAAADVQLFDVPIGYLFGQMQKETVFVDYIAPPLFTPEGAETVKWPQWVSDEWMEIKSTLRAEGAPYQHSTSVPTTDTSRLNRHSWACMEDERTLKADLQNQLGIREKCAVHSRMMVKNSLKAEARDAFVLAANFAAGHDVTNAGGSEWDAAGVEPRDQIDVGIDKICSAVGVDPQDLGLYLPQSSRIALYSNANFRTWNVGDLSKVSGIPNANVIADFFGVGSVLSENAWAREAGVTGPLFADVAILFLPGVGGDYDTTFGEKRWIAQFRPNDGIARDAYFNDERSSFVWPYDEEYAIEVLEPKAAFIQRNTKA